MSTSQIEKRSVQKTFLKALRAICMRMVIRATIGCGAEITVIGCWAHARRKFDEAHKGLPEKARAGSLALRAKKYCDKLFTLERDFADLSAEKRYLKRQGYRAYREGILSMDANTECFRKNQRTAKRCNTL